MRKRHLGYCFHFQNSFILMVHKIQDLSLSRITVFIDENVFIDGQVYVVLNSAKSLDKMQIFEILNLSRLDV